MTVSEMHIEIQQATQKVAANRTRKWYDHEIDWILNKMQDRFIESCLRPREDGSGGFQLDQVKAEHIRALITRVSLDAYIDSSERYKCFLPANYAYLLADWSYTSDLCGAAVPTASNRTQYISSIPQNITEKVAAPYYASMVWQFDSNILELPADLPAGNTFTGFPEKQDKFFLVPYALHRLKTIYFDKFDSYEHPGQYIYVSTTAPAVVAVETDGTIETGETTVTRVLTYHAGTGTRHNNRLSSSAVIPSLSESPHWKSSHFSPLSELEEGNLYIHRDNSFIVTGAGISYVRKPRPISLSLNTDCELVGYATHMKICDLAVEYIKGTVQNPEATQLKTADIAKRVTL